MEPRPGPAPSVLDGLARALPATVVPPPVIRVVSRGPESTLIVLSGELDVASAPQLAPLAGSCGTPGRELVVDAGEITFLDCAGLRAVLAIARPSGAVRWSRTSRGVDLLLGALQLRPERLVADLTRTDLPVAATPLPPRS